MILHSVASSIMSLPPKARVGGGALAVLAALLLAFTLLTEHRPIYQQVTAHHEQLLDAPSHACNYSAPSAVASAVPAATPAPSAVPAAPFRSHSSPATFNFSTPIWSRMYGELVMRDNPKFSAEYLSRGTEALMSFQDMHGLFGSEAMKWGGYIWIRSSSAAGFGGGSDVLEFAAHIMPYMTEPFVLISTDGDVAVPSELLHDDCATVYRRIVENPYLVAWFTQNFIPFETTSQCNVSTTKVRPLPIGLDLHTWAGTPQHKVDVMRKVQKQVIDDQQWTARKHRILADLNSKTHPSRVTLEQLLTNAQSKHIDFHQREQFEDALRSYGSYKFALSPRGNGLDCHRTWELLMMKTIPIVLTSSLDPMYEGLPVVIVQDWQEVLVEENLAKWEKQHINVIQAGSPADWLNPWRWLNTVPPVVVTV